ncbi:MAG: hypothetical protein J7551_03570 [Chloroflexi bacterium]|jgi:hypothetical protein|nr:hypothetical protein [Chloroflexota bacterium]
MRRFRRALGIIAVIAVLLAVPAPIQAQDRVTYTITEQEINAYRLPPSARRFVSAVNVDLQSGQAVVMAKVVNAGLTLNTVSVWQPIVSNGRLSWQAISATVEGVPLSAAQLAMLNSAARRAIEGAVRRYIDSRARGRYTVESVSITESELVVTVLLSR